MRLRISIDKLFRIYLIVTVLNLLLFAFLYFVFPQLRKIIFDEDHLVENLTVLFYLISFFISIFFIIQTSRKRFQRLHLIFPLIGIFGFLEEMSYGQRIFHYNAPVVVSEQFDALHDLVPIGYSFLMMHAQYLYYLVPIGICAAILWLYIKHRQKIYSSSRLFESYPSFGFLFVALGFIFISEIYDLRLVKPDFKQLIEEVLEMNAALTLFFAVLATRYDQVGKKNIKQSASIQTRKLSSYFYKMFVVLIILGVASFILFSITTAQLVKQNELYLKNNVLKVFTSWDSEKIIKEMPPELINSVIKRQNIKNLFSVMQKKLGRLENFTLLESGPLDMNEKLEYFKQGKNIVIFSNIIDAQFEKADIQLVVLTIKRENRWMFLGAKHLRGYTNS